MDIFEFFQKFFLILLPGILGCYLYSLLNIQKEQHYYIKFLNITILSFAANLLSDCLLGSIKLFFPCFILAPINIVRLIGESDTIIPTANVFVAIVFAILLSCLATKASSENWLFKIANKLKITRRTDNQTVWEHVFDDGGTVVMRDLVTKNIYYGNVLFYSDDSENREIFFEDVRVYDKHARFLYSAERIYLSRAHNEFSVEIYDYTKDNEGDVNNATEKS